MSRTVPFTVLEEAVYNIEQTFTPWNIQLELETSEPISIDRLESAVRTACAIHPLARAQKCPASTLDTDYVWEIPDVPDAGSITERTDSSSVSAARSEFYAESFDLEEEPPFRVLVLRGKGIDDGDRLCLSVSHTPADGVATLRLLRTICRAYRGEKPAAEGIPLAESRQLVEEIRPSGLSDRVQLLGAATSHLGKLLDRPSRLASDSTTGQSGWGFVHRQLDETLFESVVENRPADTSINDMLLTAVHLAVDIWNSDHGDPAGKISLLMPVNLRPEEWFYDVFGMYALFESIVTRPTHRDDPQSAVEAVRSQTTTIKQEQRAAALLESLNLVPNVTPVGIKRRSPELLRGPGESLVDTVMLSNLGRVPELSGIGEAEPTLWFSPPSWQPTPVSIGVVTAGGTMQIVFRHMYTALDDAAAIEFADCFERQLRRLV
ncbi:hypothetical protein [Halovenus sp. HT40]|uniref:hypothetical protein n=1 Tax=Halovenus sp. HT40 TaxID=3126691 RepID=UPI00300EFF17